MALPDYFGRNAVAAAQAIAGFDEERLADVLNNVCVGITIGHDAQGAEGQALVDLLTRLLARLYPQVVFRADRSTSSADDAAQLALRINPNIELDGKPTIEIVVGSSTLEALASQRIFAGSNGWTAFVSTTECQRCGESKIPFGAGAAACLAAANLFRSVFLENPCLDLNAALPLGDDQSSSQDESLPQSLGDIVLAGAGAIGNATAWALARIPTSGRVAIVDPEPVDLGNLQRYVLAERGDEHSEKASLASRYFDSSVKAESHNLDLARFVETHGHRVDRLLLALDSARDRRVGQACLPRWVANAWTQPSDLGVSCHDFLNGACVCCLYLPAGTQKHEDALIAESFGVNDRLMQIRVLLYRGEGVPRDLLEAISTARNVPLDRLLPFEGRPVRTLYTEGFCGGAVIPLKQIGAPRHDVHVPLAHQSALAGLLLAAAAVRNALGIGNGGSSITQIDLMKPLQAALTRPAAKDPRGICICQDPDYRAVYASKFEQPPVTALSRQT